MSAGTHAMKCLEFALRVSKNKNTSNKICTTCIVLALHVALLLDPALAQGAHWPGAGGAPARRSARHARAAAARNGRTPEP